MSALATPPSPRTTPEHHHTPTRASVRRGNRLTPAQRDEYAAKYMPLADRIAGTMTTRDEDRDEISSDAMFGLTKALLQFDPTIGTAFTTYAYRRITGAILDGKRRRDHLSRTDRRYATEWASQHDGKQADRYAPPVSLDALHTVQGDEFDADADGIPIHPAAPDVDMIETVYQDQLAVAVHDALALLPCRLRLILLLRFWHEYTQPEIGDVLGVTASRVSQMETKAEKKLAAALHGIDISG